MTQLSIIIPVFNEVESLPETINQLKDFLDTSDFVLEVIFVNDGSTDGSGKILKKINNPLIKIVNHETNRGYGAALKTGIAFSSAEYVCIIDADCTYPINEINNLFQHINNGYSMITGSRTGTTVRIPFLRKFPKWILNKLVNYLTNMDIPDLNSGLRIMKKSNVERFMKILPDSFSFTTTITLAMHTNNLKVLYLPINYHYRKGKSKIRPIYDTLNFTQLIIRTCLYFNPLKIFIPFAGILIILAFLVALLSHLFLDHIMDVTFGTIMMTAVIILAIGMLADLIDKRID
jgi:glycosyltransferase involved in cell wall biosynthesis